MDLDKITQELNTRFAQPLPEFYQRRIIIWFDEENEFSDKLDELNLDSAKLIKLNNTNTFAVKKILNHDDTTSNYLLYNPLTYSDQEDNWLLDIELYSESFRADLLSIWMDNLNINANMRDIVKYYRKYFNAKTRRDKFKTLATTQIAQAKDLHLTVMAALANAKEAKPNAIIQQILLAGLDENTNRIYQDFITYGADKILYQMVRKLGYKESELNLYKLAEFILSIALAQVLPDEDQNTSLLNQARCYTLVTEWLHSGDEIARKGWQDIASLIEQNLNLPRKLTTLPLSDLAEIEILPCIDSLILLKIMEDIKNDIIDTDLILQTAAKRQNYLGYKTLANYYQGLIELAHMQNFYKEHVEDFHLSDINELWTKYTSQYYLMDTYYRSFYRYNAHIDIAKNYRIEFHDLWNEVKNKVENLYTHWFLTKLGENWSTVAAANLQKYGRVNLAIAKQTDFYTTHVEHSDSRLFVIISDAMRYEIAAELANELKQTQGDVDLSSMEGIFPTITKFGMASLLPHEQLTVDIKANGNLAVLADGKSSEANNRDKILKLANKASVAIKYEDIISINNRANRRALVKDKQIIYIYHDTIDEAGHLDNDNLCTAASRAIGELKNLVRIMVNDFSATKILITADHGFIYTHEDLSDADKIDKEVADEQIIELGRRYMITTKSAKVNYLMPVNFLNNASPYTAFTPRENIRIKLKGSTTRFVHGGISPQEIIVPLIKYHHLRNQSKIYQNNKQKYALQNVTLGLLSSMREINNMSFSLNFYQKESVSHNYQPSAYQLYFTDNKNQIISDIQNILADKTTLNEQDRIFKCKFNLKPQNYANNKLYYLVMLNKTTDTAMKEEFQINIPFILDDVDFFA